MSLQFLLNSEDSEDRSAEWYLANTRVETDVYGYSRGHGHGDSSTRQWTPLKPGSSHSTCGGLSPGSDHGGYPASPASSMGRSHSSRLSLRRLSRAVSLDDEDSADDETCETICYGMIHKVDVKLMGDLTAIAKKLRQTSPSSSSSSSSRQQKTFIVTEQPDHILLSFPDGTPFGYLRSHMKNALAKLLDRKNLAFEAVAEAKALQDTVAKARKTSGAVARVDLYVYGSRRLAPVVGDRLSKWKLWLQRPEAVRRGAPYENPHFLAF
ncbi:hypothetical protein HYQ45_000114 [Verticillium longisporum]|uniref:Uncharacterized protein n=1 Tax=Verticillium longisporum TaxID=100787 RepID=A0A8I3A457_VERLO|nr:hypothetical protein HYQ45_000114 [Verticillium longisporum]